MKKTKEEALLTRKRVLNAGFKCFHEIGYERTSMTTVAQTADLSRGAVYGHFENKEALFRAVVNYNLPYAQFWHEISLPKDMRFPDRLAELFWYGLDNNPHVDFIFNTIAFSRSHEEFSDIVTDVQQIKNALWNYIEMEIKKYLLQQGVQCSGTKYLTSSLALMFEGMFLTKSINTKIELDKESVIKYTNMVCAPLLSKTEPDRWESIVPLTISELES